jgi:hypothetical protein
MWFEKGKIRKKAVFSAFYLNHSSPKTKQKGTKVIKLSETAY